MIRIYGPEEPPKGHFSALDPSVCGPGMYKLIQNMRWIDHAFQARGGTVLYIAAPVSGAAIVDWWMGELNGTSYIVGAFTVGTKMELWYSSLGSSWSRISEVGGYHGGSSGDTRFSTLSGRVTMCPIKAPQGYSIGTLLPSRDVLLICNGEDYNRIWDPGRSAYRTINVTAAADSGGVLAVTFDAVHTLNSGDTIVISGCLGNTAANGSFWVTRISTVQVKLYTDEARTVPVVSNGVWTSGGTYSAHSRMAVHQPVTVPTDASVLSQKHSFHRFWQVRGNTGKTYYSSGVVNDTAGTNQFDFSNGPYDVYTGTNSVIVWTWGTAAAAAQIATVYFANASLALGKGLVIFTEDVTVDFGAEIMLGHVKIETNTENVGYAALATSWQTIYDPTDTDDKYRRPQVTQLAGPDTDPARLMWFFPTDHLSAANKLIYHLRVTRLTLAPTPAVTAKLAILAICGGGSYPGGWEWTVSYEDEPGRSESYGIVAGGGPSGGFPGGLGADGTIIGGGSGSGGGSAAGGSSSGAGGS